MQPTEDTDKYSKGCFHSLIIGFQLGGYVILIRDAIIDQLLHYSAVP